MPKRRSWACLRTSFGRQRDHGFTHTMHHDLPDEPSLGKVAIESLVVSSHDFGYRTMRMFFLGGLLLTVLLVALSAAADAGPDPLRRFALLGAMLAGWSYCCIASEKTSEALRSSRLVFVLVAALVVAAVLDGGLRHSIVECEESILLGIAAVSGSVRRLLSVSALLSVGKLATLPLGYASRRLLTEPVLADLVTQWSVTVVLVALLLLWSSSWKHIPARLADVRGGAPALTPALSAATTGLPLLGAGSSAPIDRLTPAERAVVRQLAEGLAPKEIAHQSQPTRSINTIRVHIKNAKRKTGASTVAELVALYCEHEAERS